MKIYKNICEEILSKAGIVINGDKPWDIKVANDRVYKAVVEGGSLALGRAYVNGWWECNHLEQFFEKACRAKIYNKLNFNWLKKIIISLLSLFNQQQFLYNNPELNHYELGNELFALMLGANLTYSCGYWKKARTLEEAQFHKYELICKKLDLRSGMRLLDVGCGYGGLAIYAANNFGVEVWGVTTSKQQCLLAKQRCKKISVKIHLKDYREVKGKFDRIVSVGMFEHVGCKNYKEYFTKMRNLLEDDGLFLLHTIGSNVSNTKTDPWIDKYIFHKGMIPSIAQIGKSYENLLVMEDWHNFGIDYAKTITCWYNNFIKNWPMIEKRYSEKFKRMWSYYLLQCIGDFKARDNQLWQIVFSKNGLINGYVSIRP